MGAHPMRADWQDPVEALMMRWSGSATPAGSRSEAAYSASSSSVRISCVLDREITQLSNEDDVAIHSGCQITLDRIKHCDIGRGGRKLSSADTDIAQGRTGLVNSVQASAEIALRDLIIARDSIVADDPNRELAARATIGVAVTWVSLAG